MLLCLSAVTEIVLSASIAICTGLGWLTSKTHHRINELDTRLDAAELRMAREYVAKKDLTEAVDRVEAHMIRIESKLDKIVITSPHRY